MKKCDIGGQAVIEGVMMKNDGTVGIAVRKESGEIVTDLSNITSAAQKPKITKIPVIRGIVNFAQMMTLGVKTLLKSADMYGTEEEVKPSKFETFVSKKTGIQLEDVVIGTAVVIGLVFALFVFSILPTTMVGFLKSFVNNHVALSLIEGVTRLLIFIVYILLISKLKDIKRVFQYHGAEHKVIHCYEHEKELTVENVRSFTTLHPRCGTAFLFIVMLIAIVVFSFLSWDNVLIRIITKLALLPIVAGVAYEFVKLAGRSENKLVKILIWPGLMMQKLTTNEPDDQQIEVAIKAFEIALDNEDN